MFDMHYDLLTLAYLSSGDKKYKHLFESADKMKGILANLYFMSKDEMAKELNYPQDINVLEMFKKAKKILESYNLKTHILYGIEGCDYIKDVIELEELKNEGLNSIVLVWNCANKYGSGNRTNQRLTDKGKEFIQKAIDLNLGIDLSHANKETFYDIIKEVKKAKNNGKKVICFASHSNICGLYDIPRNLNYDQLKELKDVGGYLGIVSYPKFLIDGGDFKEAYVTHVLKAIEIMGIDRVMLSSDNMDFINCFTKENSSDKAIYDYSEMAVEVRRQLLKVLCLDDVNKVMYENANEIYNVLSVD